MHSNIILSSLILSSSLALAVGLYPKDSPVLNLDAKSYEKLIAKSNYTSIVEFYAPWCGHCKNLKPAYEKAAASLAGLANVAAINCDDEENKQFCGSMNVPGFPTLKIVKPAKKAGGRPVVEDYQGARTAKGINDAVVDKIPNHVSRLKDDGLEAWLGKDPERPKAIFFSDKGIVSPLIKAIAIDFLDSIDVAQVRSTEKKTVEKFGVTTFPSVLLLPGGGKEPINHTGDMKKESLITALSQLATPNPDALPATADQKPKPSKPSVSKAKKAKASATTETPNDASNPTQSPSPNVATDVPPPVQLPVVPAPRLTMLEDEAALQKSCLHTKASICVLAFAAAEDDAVTALGEVAHKHKQRGAKIFPFYAVPDGNAAGKSLIAALGLEASAAGQVEVLAVNAKRGWWTRFSGDVASREAVEGWVDNIRFGEVSKGTLPEGLVQEIQQEVVAKKEPKKMEVNLEDINLDELRAAGFDVEMVEIDEDDPRYTFDEGEGHDEL